MTTETFDLLFTTIPNAAANGSGGPQFWPETPPPADPVSGGTAKLWQYQGAAWSQTEIYQPAHVVQSVVANPPESFGQYSVELSSSTSAFNALAGPVETVPQTNIVCFLNKNYAGNTQFCGNTTSSAGDGGFMFYEQSLTFDGIRFLSRGIAANDTIPCFSYPRTSFLIAGVSHTSTSRQAYVHGVGSASRTGVSYTSSGGRAVNVGATFSAAYSRGQIISCFAQIDMSFSQANFLSFCTWLASVERERGVPVYGP